MSILNLILIISLIIAGEQDFIVTKQVTIHSRYNLALAYKKNKIRITEDSVVAKNFNKKLFKCFYLDKNYCYNEPWIFRDNFIKNDYDSFIVIKKIKKSEFIKFKVLSYNDKLNYRLFLFNRDKNLIFVRRKNKSQILL